MESDKLRKLAQKLDDYGRGGDTIVAHINPREAALLKALGGSGTINPKTGLLEFMDADGQGTSEAGAVGGGVSSDPGYGTVDTFGGDLSQSQKDAYTQFADAMDTLGGKGGVTLGGVGGIGYESLDRNWGESPTAQSWGREAGWLGRVAGRAVDNPAATVTNMALGSVFGPAYTIGNALYGAATGKDIGRGIVGEVAGFTGHNGPQALGVQTAEGKPGGNPKGDGGPLSAETTGGGGYGPSGSGYSPIGGNSVQSPLAAALLGEPVPSMNGRKTYGAPAFSYSPFGQQYTTPWAYRG